jgi:hypothetical protein
LVRADSSRLALRERSRRKNKMKKRRKNMSEKNFAVVMKMLPEKRQLNTEVIVI